MTEESIAAELARIDQHLKNDDERLKALEETIKRIESLTLSVEKLAFSVEKMAKEQVDYRQKQNDLANKIIGLEKAPLAEKAGKHDKLMAEIITLLLGAIVGYLLKSLLGI